METCPFCGSADIALYCEATFWLRRDTYTCYDCEMSFDKDDLLERSLIGKTPDFESGE